MRALRLAIGVVWAALCAAASGDARAQPASSGRCAPPAPFRGLAAIETAPGIAPPRAAPRVSRRPARLRAAAFARLVRDTGPAWRGLWDEDTGAPLRLYGGHVDVPGAVAHAAVAAAHARAFLDAHADLLAPGARAADFELLSNHEERGLRTVAFEQRVSGVRVPGARVSFRYKNDRLFVLGSEALASPPALAMPRGTPAGELVLHRIVRRGGEDLRLALVVDSCGDDLFVDPATGAPIARESRRRFVTALVAFDAPVRGPEGARASYPAPLLDVTVDGVPATTDASGQLTWSGTAGSVVALSPTGALVDVENQAGAEARASFPLGDAPVTWSLADDEVGDAQLSAFIHAGIAQAYARVIAPDLPFLSEQLVVKPNIDNPDGCNALWDGTGLEFYRQQGDCQNTARVADVVYHELGHGLHQNAILPGAGALDPALGEGSADYLAVTITGDPNVAPGFYVGQPTTPLRDVETNKRWPEDVSDDAHQTGLIWSGALWDLRKALIDDLGDTDGRALADQLYYEALRRAPDIPAGYVEVLAADDDDGDLDNGTPHFCAINGAFAAHGLGQGLDASGLELVHTPPSVVPAGEEAALELDLAHLFPHCAGADITSVVAKVSTDDGSVDTIPFEAAHGGYAAQLPAMPAGTSLRYHVEVTVGGAVAAVPDNPADPDYAVYYGDVTPIACSGFEDARAGWSLDGFEIGAPAGLGGDPVSAYSGAGVVGTGLGDDGLYAPSTHATAISPAIDPAGQTDLRLQLRRWLTIEDGLYDHATIEVNGALLWQNAGTDAGVGSLDLVDREWRFVDLDLSSVAREGALTITFGLDSDGTDELGGWNLDDVCVVVAPRAAAEPSGHTDAGGGCSCRAADRGAGGWKPALALTMAAAWVARRRRRVLGRDTCSPG